MMKRLQESLHYQSLLKIKISDCYAIDGGCALHIKNDETYSAISFKGNKNSYFVERKDPNIIENTLSVKHK